MKVVVDTNCLIVSIPAKNPEFWLYKSFREEKFTWLVSTEILNEYYEKISEFYSPTTADIVISALLSSPNVELAEPYFHYNLIVEDPDDNKFANLAISSNATYLVSNDKHFNIFKHIDFPPLNVVTLNEFQGIITKL